MRRDVWIFLFVLGAVLFDWPVISIFRESLAFYFFGVWFAFIVLVALATRGSKKGENGG